MSGRAEINQILNDAVFKHTTKQIVDGLTGTIRLYAEAGIEKDVTVEMIIGDLNRRGLVWLSGAARVIAGKVFREKAYQKRRERIEKFIKTLFLRR